jgi:hypothetical protein
VISSGIGRILQSEHEWEYTCKTVLRGRPDSVEIVGRMQGRYTVYDPDFEPNERGRPRKWGDKLGSLEDLADHDDLPWFERMVQMYGEPTQLQIKWLEVQWKSAHADDRLTVILIRDPSGTYDDAYFVRTCADAPVADVLGPACRRWGIEVAFRNCKQHLRISSVQNGFAQGAEPNDPDEPGPSAPEGREPTASRRTVPFGMITYGVVVLWYLEHGEPDGDIRRAKALAPWYTQKEGVSFWDMLQAFRRQMEIEDLWQTPSEEGWWQKDAPSSASSGAKAA